MDLQFLIAQILLFASTIDSRNQWNKSSSTCLSKQLSFKNSFPLKKIENFCSKCDEWERQFVEGGPGSSETPVLPLEAQKWVKPLWVCRNLDCVCQFRESGCSEILKKNRSGEIADYDLNQPEYNYRRKRSASSQSLFNMPLIFKKVKRKEIRSLSDEERQRLFDALNQLKNTKIDRGLSRFDTLITYHIPERAVTAHFCPSFFPFHREFLKVTEFALREIDPDISIPYWDLTMDSMLPDPRDSILWTKEFMGTGEGRVVDGPFAHWKPWPDPAAPKHLRVDHLKRNVGKESMGEIVRLAQIKRIMNMKTFKELTFCHSSFVEMIHGFAHMWVGGHMVEFRTAPNDPIFFFFHSFFDKIWEQWRHLRQTREQREIEYADGSCMQHCSSSMHEPLMPFPTTEHEALSNWYTDNLYGYEPSPTCSVNKLDCGSKYLFCDQRRYVCLPKVRIGGNCTGFERYQMTDICFKSVCSMDGVCVDKMVEKTKTTKGFVFPETKKNATYPTEKIPSSPVKTSSASTTSLPVSTPLSSTIQTIESPTYSTSAVNSSVPDFSTISVRTDIVTSTKLPVAQKETGPKRKPGQVLKASMNVDSFMKPVEIDSNTTARSTESTSAFTSPMPTTELDAESTLGSTLELTSLLTTTLATMAVTNTTITPTTTVPKEKNVIFSIVVLGLDSSDQQKLVPFDDVTVSMKMFMERFIMVFKGWKINDRKNDHANRFFVEFSNPATMGLLPLDISLAAFEKRDKTLSCMGFCRISPRSENYGLCSNMSAKREEDVGIKIDYHDIEKGSLSATSDSFAFLCGLKAKDQVLALRRPSENKKDFWEAAWVPTTTSQKTSTTTEATTSKTTTRLATTTPETTTTTSRRTTETLTTTIRPTTESTTTVPITTKTPTTTATTPTSTMTTTTTASTTLTTSKITTETTSTIPISTTTSAVPMTTKSREDAQTTTTDYFSPAIAPTPRPSTERPAQFLPDIPDEVSSITAIVSNLDASMPGLTPAFEVEYYETMSYPQTVASTDSSNIGSKERATVVWETTQMLRKPKAIVMPSSLNFVAIDQPPAVNEQGACKNHDEDCDYWASENECEANPMWMHRFCALACNKC